MMREPMNLAGGEPDYQLEKPRFLVSCPQETADLPPQSESSFN